jgi:tetratricopeptide (TPR) repeat protein
MLLVLIVACGLPFAVHSAGRAEKEARSRLAEVERLIDARKYNEAILRLAEIAKDNPDLFDAAEQLMNRIRKARSQYNAMFEEMVRTLFEEKDIEKALKLIAELQRLDPYPNPAMAKALELASHGRNLAVNLKKFTEIMDAAALLLRAGRYADANAKYLETFALGRQAFDEVDYGNIIKNSVFVSLDSVHKAVDELPAPLAALAQVRASLAEAAETANQERIGPLLREASGGLRRIAELKGALRAAEENFILQEQQIRIRTAETAGAESGGADRSYDQFLFFAEQAVGGRAGKGPEGLIGVMGLAWDSQFGELKSVLLKAAEARWSEGVRNYSDGACGPRRYHSPRCWPWTGARPRRCATVSPTSCWPRSASGPPVTTAQ